MVAGRPGAVAVVSLVALVATACGTDTARIEASGIARAQPDDDRTLEEKVDTDGDGEMSEDEITAYAQEVFQEFSQCMRDSGFPDFTDVTLEDFTDSPTGGGGQGAFLQLMASRGVSLGDPDSITALQECGEDLADLQTFAPEPSDDEVAEQERQLLEFAECMREQGLSDWPDPDFAANPRTGYGVELTEEFDINSAEVQEAGATCQAEGRGFAVDGEASDDDSEPTPPAEAPPAASDDPDPDPEAPTGLIPSDTQELTTAEVTRRDLVHTKALDGTLGFGEERPFPTNTTGIVTALPAAGEVIEFGETLFEVDDVPVLLFEGTLPQYRPFEINMTDGADVAQLERNLTDLGYVVDRDLTVDDDFTGVTQDVIRDLQDELGVDETGELALGLVAFSEGPIRVASTNVELGQTISPQVTVLAVTEVDQRITVALDAEDRSLVEVLTGVDIELPDGTTALGVVSEVADVATRSVNPQTGASTDATIEVEIVFAGPPPDGVFDAAPVEIVVTEEITADVLTVPVPALIALAEGGHAVELVVDGGTQLVAVEIGDFVDSLVEVRGDLREGDRVVMASS